MKAKELRARATDDLKELRATMKKELFSNRMKNFTNQLEDTSQIQKARRDLARLEGILRDRAKGPVGTGGDVS